MNDDNTILYTGIYVGYVGIRNMHPVSADTGADIGAASPVSASCTESFKWSESSVEYKLEWVEQGTE